MARTLCVEQGRCDLINRAGLFVPAFQKRLWRGDRLERGSLIYFGENSYGNFGGLLFGIKGIVGVLLF